MASHQEDIASKLLSSADARIAEAAKRVFSSAALPAAAASLAALSAAPPSALAGAFDEPTMPGQGESHYDGYAADPAAPLHGGAQHTADISGAACESMESNDEVPGDQEGSEKKPSSTERLKRR